MGFVWKLGDLTRNDHIAIFRDETEVGSQSPDILNIWMSPLPDFADDADLTLSNRGIIILTDGTIPYNQLPWKSTDCTHYSMTNEL